MEDKLTQLKGIYISTHVPEHVVNQTWEELLPLLPEQDPVRIHRPVMRYALLFTSILIVILGGVIGISQNSKPGSALYPVKVLSDQVAKQVNKDLHSEIGKPIHITPTPTHRALPTATPPVTNTPTPSPKPQETQSNGRNDNSNTESDIKNLKIFIPTESQHQDVQGASTENNSQGNSNNQNNSNENSHGNGNHGNGNNVDNGTSSNGNHGSKNKD